MLPDFLFSSIVPLKKKQSVYKDRFKPNNWCNNDCLVRQDRQRFWYGIWRSCGWPREGHVYLC